MTDPIQLRPRPPVDLSQLASRPALNVQAQPRDYGLSATPANPYAELTQALGQLNPALNNYANVQAQIAGKANDEQAKQDKVQGLAEGHGLEYLQSVRGVDPATWLPEARSPAFREGFATTVAQRLGIEAKSMANQQFEEQKDLPTFNVDSFLQQSRRQALQGINDPHMATIIGQHMTDFEAFARQDFERQRTQQRQQAVASSQTAIADDAFQPSMTPQEWADRSEWFKEQARAVGVSYQDAAGYIFQRAIKASFDAGGMPELFDSFSTIKDKDGFTLLERNPQLAGALAAERAKAYKQRDDIVQRDSQVGLAKTYQSYEEDLRSNPAAITQERVLGDIGEHGMFSSGREAASMLMRAKDAMADQAVAQQAAGDFYKGQLGYQSTTVQQKVLQDQLGGVTRAIWEATQQGDQKTIEQLMPAVIQAQSRSRATVPVDSLVRLIDGLVSNAPNAAGPDARFGAAEAIYRALSPDPKVRAMYFKEEPAKLLEAYTSAKDSGADPVTAYTAAYRSISPEARDAAEKRLKDPEVQKVIATRVTSHAAGSSWWPTWLGGDGRPENNVHIQAAAGSEARKYLTLNPDATDKQLEQHLDNWSAKSFALDSSTGVAIKTPAGMGGDQAAEAFTNYSRALVERYKANGAIGDGWNVRYMPNGTEGQYQVELFNGSASKLMGSVSLPGLLDWERQKRLLTPAEGTQLVNLRQALQAGQPLPEVPPELLGKAKAVNFFSTRESLALRQAMLRQTEQRVGSIPAVSFGQPSSADIAFNPAKAVPVDQALTSQTALQFAASPVTGPDATHQGLAASLITMGEGMVLQAYSDPARGAGKDIGMGYNLAANQATVDADLKRSGVPQEALQAVKDGTAKLTPDQAVRLLRVALPRYETEARNTAEETQVGLWQRMTPIQRAVMIDVAWQMGDSGRFKKAWSALAAGDQTRFADEAKVFYVNRNGDRVEDTRRNNLRANMLAGIERWNALVSAAGNAPQSKLLSAPKPPPPIPYRNSPNGFLMREP